MVASTHWLASAAGMATLEAGGNAFDAAVAAGLTLQVVEPHLNGPGGEVPVLFARSPRAATGAGVPVVLSGQGGAQRWGAPRGGVGRGARPRRRDDRGLPRPGSEPGSRHRSPRRHRARRP